MTKQKIKTTHIGSFNVRFFEQETINKLKRQAADNGRSLNKHILYLIDNFQKPIL